MLQRIVGVFKLDAATFEDIEADQNATSQAAVIVLAVAILGAIANSILAAVGGTGVGTRFLFSLVAPFIGWFVASGLIYVIGSVLGGKATMGETLRVIGFSYAPQILAIIPCIGAVIGAIWSAVAMFIGVRQALDFSNAMSCLTLLIYLGVYLVISAVLGVGALTATSLLQ